MKYNFVIFSHSFNQTCLLSIAHIVQFSKSCIFLPLLKRVLNLKILKSKPVFCNHWRSTGTLRQMTMPTFQVEIRSKQMVITHLIQKISCLTPNTQKSYKILQRLSPKHAVHGVAQSAYPICGHGKACFSKQLSWHAAGDPHPKHAVGPGFKPRTPWACWTRIFSPPSLPSFFVR